MPIIETRIRIRTR